MIWQNRTNAGALLRVMARASSWVGNLDPVARKMGVPSGLALFEIENQPESVCWVRVRERFFSSGIGQPCDEPDVRIIFSNSKIVLAAAEQKLDSLAAVGVGDIRISGLVPLADGLSLVMGRLGVYFRV